MNEFSTVAVIWIAIAVMAFVSWKLALVGMLCGTWVSLVIME